MGNNQRLGWVGVMVCSLAASGCVELDGDEPEAAPSVELDEVRAVTGAVDAMRERARRAFVARDGVLRGGDATAGAEVSERGIALTPYRWRDDATDEPGATLVLETASITRGGRPLAAAIAAPPVLTRGGDAELDRGGAVEVVRTVDRGIEQTWRFGGEPAATADAADADLVVRVAVTGQRYAGHTATGHHFVDPATGLGFAYGDATWVDATGARSAVPVAYTGGELVLTVPAAVVRRSVYPAVLDPVVSAEFGLDTPIVGPAVGGQFTPDVAFSGTEYLVVWADHRRENTFTSDVFAARVTTAGGVLDPAGIHVPTTNISGHQLDPAVAFGGNQWFIVYAETTTPQIRGMRLATDGTPLSPDFDVTSRDFATIESQPDIAFNPGFFGIPDRFMVTWRLTNGGIQVQSHSVSTSTGTVATATVTTEPSAQHPAIAAGGITSGFVVTWDDQAAGNANVMARQVTANANALGTLHAVTTDSSAQTNPAIAFAPGVGYLVVWEDNRTGNVDLWGNVLMTSGAPQPSNASLISASNTQSAPALAVGGGANGRMMLLTWTDTRTDSAGDVFGARMEPLGGGVIALFDGSGFAISAAPGAQQTSAVAFNGGFQFLAVWRDERTTSPNIVGARVGTTGAVFEPNGIVLGQSFNQQTAPAVAACGGRYLAVWSDTRNGDVAPDIYGALTDSSNPPVVLAANIAISTAAGRQDVPAVACNGTDFFVVWGDERTIGASNRDIYGARVRASDGAVLDPGGVVVSNAFGAQTDPAITYVAAASTYGVAWADGRSGDYDVYLKEVSAAGVVDHASEVNVSGAVIGDQWWPDLTGDAPFAGASPRFFVVWQDGRGTWSGWDVYGRFLGLDGTLDPTTIAISTTFGAQTAPTVATKVETSPGDTRWHVVAYDSASPLVTPGIYASVVSPAGAVGVPAALAATTADTEGAPDLTVRDGAAMVLACHRTTGSDTFDLDVLGVDVTSTSTTVGPVGAPFVISDVPPSNVAHAVRERLPAVACGTTLSCQALYQRYADAAYTGDPPVDAGGVDRIRARVLTY